MLLGQYHFHESEYEEALENTTHGLMLFEKYLYHPQSTFNGFQMIGRIYYEMAEYEKAIENFEKVFFHIEACL